MIVNTTYRYRFNKASKKESKICSKCGKRIYKTFSYEFREDADLESINIKSKESQERIDKWKSEDAVCNQCKNDRIDKCYGILELNFTGLEGLNNQINELERQRSNILPSYFEELKGNVCIINGEEYVFQYAYICYGKFSEILLDFNKVNKNKKWLLTEARIYKNLKDISEVTFMDEKFKDRKVQL